jgi:Icc-related predicted phosphoesterase
VKILALSDEALPQIYTPDIRQRYADVDILLGCGDLPFYYLDFVTSALDAPLLYVLGNHDRGPQYTADGRVLTKVQGGENLHGRVVHEQGLLFAGFEGSMRYRPDDPLMYSEIEMKREVMRLWPRLWLNRLLHGRFLDILVTHSPPWGVHDRPDLPHRGFKVFLWFLEQFRPRYMLHGHIHLYSQAPQISQVAHTTVVNVYPLHLLEL